MVKIINDTFNINEIIDSNSTEVLLESEFTITDDMPDIERIVNIEGKTNLNNVAVTKDNITVIVGSHNSNAIIMMIKR